MNSYDDKQFMKWLRENTTLLESSISIYGRVISNYFKEHDKLTIKQVKEFISKHNREANSIHIKAPFLHFFSYAGIDTKNYDLLPPVRVMPIKRPGTYLSDEMMKRLILAIEKPVHKRIALLQYHTGIRAHEAFMIKEEKLRKTSINGTNVIEITYKVKRNKERIIYLKYALAKKIFRKYMKKQAGFLFMKRDLSLMQEENEALFWKKLQTQIRYYYNSLQKAAKKIGLDKGYGTHNFRRFFAEVALSYNGLPVVQRMMGHSRIETTMRYVKNKDEEATSAMLKMQEANG